MLRCAATVTGRNAQPVSTFRNSPAFRPRHLFRRSSKLLLAHLDSSVVCEDLVDAASPCLLRQEYKQNCWTTADIFLHCSSRSASAGNHSIRFESPPTASTLVPTTPRQSLPVFPPEGRPSHHSLPPSKYLNNQHADAYAPTATGSSRVSPGRHRQRQRPAPAPPALVHQRGIVPH